MSDVETLLVETAERVFRDHVTPDVLNVAEQGDWPTDLWRAIEDTGLARAMVRQEGGSLAAAVAVLRVAGRYSAPVPLAETMMAAWLLDASGQGVPHGPLTVAPATCDDVIAHQLIEPGMLRLSGAAPRVPWARQAPIVVVVGDAGVGVHVALVNSENVSTSRGANLAGELRDDVEFGNVEVVAHQAGEGVDRSALLRRGALARAALISGALDHLLAATVQYAGERKQFGRPIAKFQAIQHHLAALAGHTAAVSAAVHAAAHDETAFNVAVAKARASEAAGEAAAIAHQVHGAIGFTYEHSVHHSTKRLWSWREEFGNEAYWHQRLGEAIASDGADALWPTITGA